MPGANDLTGKYPSDTYGRLIQKGSDGKFYNGFGNVVFTGDGILPFNIVYTQTGTQITGTQLLLQLPKNSSDNRYGLQYTMHGYFGGTLNTIFNYQFNPQEALFDQNNNQWNNSLPESTMGSGFFSFSKILGRIILTPPNNNNALYDFKIGVSVQNIPANAGAYIHISGWAYKYF
jgi:hypothetical protein